MTDADISLRIIDGERLHRLLVTCGLGHAPNVQAPGSIRTPLDIFPVFWPRRRSDKQRIIGRTGGAVQDVGNIRVICPKIKQHGILLKPLLLIAT